jgi:hypothetical protein
LPWPDAIAVIVLKLVVIIVVAFAKGEDRHEERIARTAFGRVGLAADGVAGRVNEESAMLKHDRFRHASEEKSAKGAIPTVPDPTYRGRQNHPHYHSEHMDMAMLPHHEAVFL